MKKITCIGILLLSVISAIAQKDFYKSYTWDKEMTNKIQVLQQLKEKSKTPWDSFVKTMVTAEDFETYGAIFLNKKEILEIIYKKGEGASIYKIVHRTVLVNRDNEADNYNKLYIPLGNTRQIVEIKARVIKTDGSIVESEKSNMRVIENMEGEGDYKAFSIDGVENRCIVDYFYILKLEDLSYGTYVVQTSKPIYNYEFILKTSNKYEFEFKTYNGLQAITEEKNDDDNIIYRSSMKYIPALEEERYSPYDAYLMRIEYTLAYNHLKSANRVYALDQVGNNLYENYFNLEKSELAAIQKFYKGIKFTGKTEEQKILTIENYLKSNLFPFGEKSEYKTIANGIKGKMLSKSDYNKVFANMLRMAKIDFQIVVTTDRSDKAFDKTMDAFNFLDEFLFFFPNLKLFTSPSAMTSRLGFPYQQLTDNNGLFLSFFKLGNTQTLVGEVNWINSVPMEKSGDTAYYKITIPSEFKKIEADIERRLTGYFAYPFQGVISFYEEERKKSVAKQYLCFDSEFSDLTEFRFINTDPSYTLQKPLIIKGKVENDYMIEKTAHKYIFNVGKIIGQQSELYNTGKRKLVADMGSRRHYYRVIEVSYPKGYKPTSVEDLNMNVLANNVKAGFKSNIRVDENNNKIIITINEYYGEHIIPVEFFEEWRNVINAAADFNKKVLVFEKL